MLSLPLHHEALVHLGLVKESEKQNLLLSYTIYDHVPLYEALAVSEVAKA